MKNSAGILAFLLYGLGGYGIYKLRGLFPDGSIIGTVIEVGMYIYGVFGLMGMFELVAKIDHE